MDKSDTFEAENATIKLDKVAAVEPVETDDENALRVHLKNGSTVRLDGDEQVHDFLEAIDGHLESE